MKFYLAKTLKDMKKYGPTYDLLLEPDKVEEYVLSEHENEWILENLVDEINSHCGTLLDSGDYDFLDEEQCKSLLMMLDELPADSIPREYFTTIETLKSFATRAVSYGTGIAIDL